MAKCEICGKTTSFGNKISHSHRVSRKTWRPNIQKVRAVVDGETRKIKVCTSCLQAGKVKKRKLPFFMLPLGTPANAGAILIGGMIGMIIRSA